MKNFILLLVVSLFAGQFLNAQNVACLSYLNVSVGLDGTANLTPEVVGVNLDPYYEYTLDRSYFDCTNVGDSININLELRDPITHALLNSCWSIIIVESKIDPDPCRRPIAYCKADVTVYLNEEGYAEITPELISYIPLDPLFLYYCSPNVLDCRNLGDNAVEMHVQSRWWHEEYCIMNVTVLDTFPARTTCFSIDIDGLEFFPIDFFEGPIPPGSPFSFNARFLFQDLGKPNIKANLKWYLSNDQVIDGKDILLLNQSVHLSNKKNLVSGKMQIPYDIQEGEYFLIGDLFSSYKKYRIGFNPIVRNLNIGDDPQFRNSENRIAQSSDQNLFSIFPNPVEQQLFIEFQNVEEVQSIRLKDSFGKLQMEISKHTNFIDMSNLNSGLFVLEVTDINNKISLQKIIKL